MEYAPRYVGFLSRRHLDDVLRHLAEVRRWNDVAGESSARIGAVRVLLGARRVEDPCPLWQQRGEVAVLEGIGRHGPEAAVVGGAPVGGFVVKEPEALVLAVINLRYDQRAAYGAAVVVLSIWALRRIAGRVVVEAVGVKDRVNQVFVSGAVQFIGAGLGVIVDNRCQAPAIGRVQGAGLEAEFADRVHAGLELGRTAGGVGAPDRDAFDVDIVRGGG